MLSNHVAEKPAASLSETTKSHQARNGSQLGICLDRTTSTLECECVCVATSCFLRFCGGCYVCICLLVFFLLWSPEQLSPLLLSLIKLRCL